MISAEEARDIAGIKSELELIEDAIKVAINSTEEGANKYSIAWGKPFDSISTELILASYGYKVQFDELFSRYIISWYPS